MTYKLFRISLILVLCFGVFTTGVAEACWCQANCPCCKSQGLQYETKSSEGSTCNRCCCASVGIPCDLKKIADMASSSADDHRGKGSYPSVGTLVILTNLFFDNHPFAHFARKPCAKATTKPSAIYLQNQSLLL